MSKTLINFWLDALMLVLFCGWMWLQAVLRFVFPPGTVARDWRVWGYDYDAWFRLQFIWGCLFTFAVLVHLMLHWSWVCGVIQTKLLSATGKGKRLADDGARTILGVGLLIAILFIAGIGFFFARIAITPPAL